MMNRIYKTNFIKRSLLVGMAVVTFFTSLAAPAKAAFADTYDDYYEDYDNSDMVLSDYKGIIKTIAGNIPWGTIAKMALEPMIKEMFNIEDETSKSLKEISSKIDALKLEMDINTQKQLEAMYDLSRLGAFNQDITKVKTMTENFYSDVEIILSDKETSEAEKAVLIGAMLDTTPTAAADYVTMVGVVTSFVNGDQVNANKESIFVSSYNVNCGTSMLGSEAAMKNVAYVQEVASILDYSYKFEALVLESKIILANIMANMTKEEKEALKKKFDGCIKESNLIAECSVKTKVDIWRKNAGIEVDGKPTGIKRQYQIALDQANPTSAVSKYNAMVKKNWCSYIKAKDYSHQQAKITMVPLRLVVGKDFNAENAGICILPLYDYREYENMVNDSWDRLRKNVSNCPLEPEELQKLLKYIDKETIFAPPEKEEWQHRLNYIGFPMREAYMYGDEDNHAENDYDESSSTERSLYQFRNPIFIIESRGWHATDLGGREGNEFIVTYLTPEGNTGAYRPLNVWHDVSKKPFDPIDPIKRDIPVDPAKYEDKSDHIYHQYLWFEQADSEWCSNEEADNACYMPEIEAINKELIEALRIDEVEEEEEDDIYAATDLTVVWNTRDGQMIPKEAVSVEIGYGVTLTATSSNNWKSEVVDLILYDETGDYAYNFVDDSLYGLIAELSDDFIVTTDVITEKDENGFDERHFIVYCDAIAEEDVPEYDDPVTFYDDDPEYDDPVIFYDDEPEYDDPVILYEDVPEYDVSETYGDGIYW